jgi:hypothetical protein
MDERQVLFRGDRIARFDLRQDAGRAEHGGRSAREEAADDKKTATSLLAPNSNVELQDPTERRPRNGWLAALPFESVELRSASRERFSKNDWVLGTKNVRHKTVENSGRARRPFKGRLLIALYALATRLKRYQVCDQRDDDPKCHCARHDHCYFRSRMDVFVDKLTALCRSKPCQPLVIP